MTVSILTFESCPNAAPAIQLVQKVIRELDISVDIESVSVDSASKAEEVHFLGSPTIQIDGVDIEVTRRSDAPCFACRIYETPGGKSGVPPKDMIVNAIREQLTEE